MRHNNIFPFCYLYKLSFKHISNRALELLGIINDESPLCEFLNACIVYLRQAKYFLMFSFKRCKLERENRTDFIEKICKIITLNEYCNLHVGLFSCPII